MNIFFFLSLHMVGIATMAGTTLVDFFCYARFWKLYPSGKEKAATLLPVLSAFRFLFAGGFLLLVIADSVRAPAWVRAISPYAHLAPVPLATVNWPATLIMTGIAVALTGAGLIGYRRRDLHGGRRPVQVLTGVAVAMRIATATPVST